MDGERHEVFGRYVLLQEVGRGSMSVVYRAMQSGPMGFRKPVAIKQLVPRHGELERYLKRMVNEARISGLLRHRNVVEVYEFDQVDGTYYLSMEFVPGPTIHELLRWIPRQGPLPTPVIGGVLVQICEGLAYAHEASDDTGRPMELVHRDIKPTNVMLSLEGMVKITDFGVARASNNLFRTQTKHITRGTPFYMSPEQVRGLAIDRRSDLFSLGVLALEMVTGEPAFADDNPMLAMHKVDLADVTVALDRVTHIAPSLAPVLHRALLRDPSKRYPDARAMALACRESIEGCFGPEELAAWSRGWLGLGSPAGEMGAITRAFREEGDAPPIDPDQLTRPWYPPVDGRDEVGQPVDTRPAVWLAQLSSEDLTALAMDGIPEVSLTTADSGDADLSATREPPFDISATVDPAEVDDAAEERPRDLTATEEPSPDLTATEEPPPDLTATEEPPPDLAATGEPPQDLTVTEEGVSRATGDTAEVWPLGDTRYPEVTARGAAGDLSLSREFPEVVEVPSIEESLPPYLVREGEVDAPARSGGLALVKIGPATFRMGSDEEEEGREGDEDPHTVHITRPFRLATTALTRRQWRELYDAAGGQRENEDLPVTGLSWYDALRLCNDLSAMQGFTPAYRVGRGGVHWDRAADGFRLPSESEWECAARAGGPAAYAGGDDPDQVAWHAGNSGTRLQAVATLRPNAMGLYDMCGNVSEWVWDVYAPYPTGGPSLDPVGPLKGTLRVHRGGSVFNPVEEVRAARRHVGGPTEPLAFLGIRLARNA